MCGWRMDQGTVCSGKIYPPVATTCLPERDSVRMPPSLASTLTHDPTRIREQIATRLAFFIAGFSTAAWAPLVPLAKERLGLDEGALGLLLLCLGLGSITAM